MARDEQQKRSCANAQTRGVRPGDKNCVSADNGMADEIISNISYQQAAYCGILAERRRTVWKKISWYRLGVACAGNDIAENNETTTVAALWRLLGSRGREA